MENKYLDINTLKFLLYEVHDLQIVLDQSRFNDYDKENVELFLKTVKDF